LGRSVQSATSFMHAKVIAFLVLQVEEAKRMHEDAKRHFWHVIKKPSGLPHADRSPLFRSAVAQEKVTSETYAEAVRQLDRYMLDRTIPYHIRERLAKAGALGTE